MHELLEHFEEVHVIYDASFPEGQQAQIKIPFNPQPVNRITGNQQRLPMPSLPATAMLPLHAQGQMTPQSMQAQPDIQHHAQYPGSFDTDGMDLDMDVQQPYPPVSNQSSPSSGGSTPPDTPVSTPLSTYPSPTMSDSPKTFFNGNSQQVMYTPQAEYANSPFASPFASQPPSPQRYAFHEADGGPAVAFDTFSARPQSTHPTSSLDGALGDPIPRPQLSVTLTPFSRPPVASSAHPGALNPLTPYARYQAHFGIPGAEENSHPMVDANADGYRSGETSPVASSVAPAMLFSNSATPVSTPSGSRVPSPTPTDKSGKKSSPISKAAPAPATTTTLNAAAAAAAIKNVAAASKASSSLSRSAGAGLLLSKPFKCPKPNCNKSYKQANGMFRFSLFS
jgi:transcription factor SFP1